MKQRHHTIASAIAFGLASLVSASAQAVTWSTTNITPTPATGFTRCGALTITSLSNTGRLTGACLDSPPPYLVSYGYVTDAGGKSFTYFDSPSSVASVNESGQIAGSVDRDGAFIIQPNAQVKNFIKPFAGDITTIASKLSANGRVAGLSCPAGPASEGYTVSNDCRIFSTAPNSLTPVEWAAANGKITSVVGINTAGQLAGTAQFSGQNAPHAVISNAGGTGVRDLGSLGTGYSYASGMNEQGQVVGVSAIVTSDGFETSHVFLTGPNGGAMKDIGTLGGSVIHVAGVNRAGQVAGSTYDTQYGGTEVPFITGPNGVGMRNIALEVPAWLAPKLKRVAALNDKGEVIVVGDIGQLYLLTPDVLTPVPPVSSCTINYRVTQSSKSSFQAQITVGNQSAAAASNWVAKWNYSSRTLLLSTSAQLTLSGTSVTASSKPANKTVAANGSVSFSITGATVGGKVPTASALSGTLNGQACTTTIQ